MTYVKKVVALIVGCAIYAAGFSFFLSPNAIAPGGVSGLAIIISNFFSISAGTVNFLLNVPILMLGMWKLGGKTIFSTGIAIVVSSVFINFFGTMPPATTDLFLASTFGGVLSAFGMALLFKNGFTTGGTDILVFVLKKVYKHVKSSTLFMVIDAVVVFISLIAFKRIDIALYAVVSLFIFTKALDMALYGSDSAKLIYIISKKDDRIAERILNEMGIGFTYVNGVGPYTNEEKKIILCAVKKRTFPHLRDVVKQEDKEAFMIVTWATDIYGEGYKDHDAEEI